MLLDAILDLRIPSIVSNYATEHIPGIPNIVSDHDAIGKAAAQHLRERGFRHFAFCGYPDLFWSVQRCLGFEKALALEGVGVSIYHL